MSLKCLEWSKLSDFIITIKQNLKDLGSEEEKFY